MVSAINTKKNNGQNHNKAGRWFRLGSAKPDLPEIDQLFDLYWGGPERRITGLTLRIIGVNAAALLMLLIGIFYLGQYQNNLISAKLETFEAETEFVAAALAEGAVLENRTPFYAAADEPKFVLSPDEARQMIRRLGQSMGKRIVLFDRDGDLVADSRKLIGPGGVVHIADLEPPDDTLYSIQILKRMAGFVLKMLPDRRVLPPYPGAEDGKAASFPDVPEALIGKTTISAWSNQEERIFLSAAAPLHKNNEIIGAVFLARQGDDIEGDVGEVWINIIQVFLLTLVMTILLSIYLSGVIARPLRKLAKAAEDVRRGKSKATEIPDLSDRNDEIGELSIVLREMTQALWDRMDTIERFAADVSHELKNPLTSLRSAVETVAVVKKKGDREKLMGIIMHDIERLDRLISDISNASRLDSELSRQQLERANLKEILNTLVDRHKDPLARQRGHNGSWENAAKSRSITIDLKAQTDEEIFVLGLEGRLHQVFENLLSNALSFAPEGSTVKIRVTPLRKRVSITVQDEGPGIPEGKLESIFERFYSQRPEHEDYGKHSGLGLSICRQIVAAVGGKIFAENARDESGEVTGAKFTVILNRA